MYLIYVDESGDSGDIARSPTTYFILSALIIHELQWHQALDSLVQLRRHLRDTKGLKIREEIHAVHFINKPGTLSRIKRNDRLDIMKQCLDWVASQTTVSVITVAINKHKHPANVFEIAWKTLIQRLENTIRHQNFRGHANSEDRGLILPDNTDGQKLIALLRKMRRYNPIPYQNNTGVQNSPITHIVEDPFMKNSSTSLFHQIVDVIAYSARQLYEPNAYMRKKGATTFYSRLDAALVRQASKKHPLGIVER
ncbi:MAG: DUF3800 domain-containing protein [Chlorobi bacterium]|nr:MAG: hypothetical protein UZ07_CHB004001349 [Chlorobi bacterium OLB7]MBK8909872.1 DUF3800 domain-containing protein [Chlorobiota bacterium]MBX7215624.1 DUF3800 domain-containing protein [Candidatus Kapabacteria bacterium]